MTARYFVFTSYGMVKDIPCETVYDKGVPFIQPVLCPTDERNIIKARFEKNGNVRYAIWQLEQCPTTLRVHVQGYIEFKNKVGKAGVQGALGDPTAHVEKRRGTQEEACAYCSKDKTKLAGPWEFGVKSKGQGDRCDLMEVANAIKSGSSIYDIVEKFPVQYIHYNRGIEKMMAIREERNMDDREVEVCVLWGATGTGKTRIVMKNNREDMYVRGLASYGQTWWDGYRGQGSILFDEFYGQVKLSDMLRYLDRYPLQIPIRGSYAYARWTKVYITSNTPPWEWYMNAGAPNEVIQAFRRRIKWIYRVDKSEDEGKETMLVETPWTDAVGWCYTTGGLRPLNP